MILYFLNFDVGTGFTLQAVNLTKAVKDSVSVSDELFPGLTCAEKTKSGDANILRRTTKRVSLTCRLVLKVRKNLIKI